jgi:hypothetical protein
MSLLSDIFLDRIRLFDIIDPCRVKPASMSPASCTTEWHTSEDNYEMTLSNGELRGAEIGRLMSVGCTSVSQERALFA